MALGNANACFYIKIIDETVRVAKKFLEKHPEEVRKLGQVKKGKVLFSKKGLLVGAFLLAKFLGKNWSETRISDSLNRLRATGQIPDIDVRI